MPYFTKMRCSSATHRLSALLLTDATPMLIRAGPRRSVGSRGQQAKQAHQQRAGEIIHRQQERLGLMMQREENWTAPLFSLTHDLFHHSDHLGRLVQHFLGQRFHLVAVNELGFETLFFGVGNELRAGDRFGITRA